MAFYYNRGDYSRRLDGDSSGNAPSAQLNASQERLSLALDEDPLLHSTQPGSSHSAQLHRRREKYGDALRLTKQAPPRREKRLAKILGDLGSDAGDRSRAGSRRSHTTAPPASPTNYTAEVLINSDGRVSYGSWRGLIAYLTSPQPPAEEYTRAFFLTFRIFSTPTDLSDALVARGRALLRAPQPPAAETRGSGDQTQAAPVHRVFRAMKEWYEDYWYPEVDDPILRELCRFILHEYLPKCHGAAARECRDMLHAVASAHSGIGAEVAIGAKTPHRSNGSVRGRGGTAGDEARDSEAPVRQPRPRRDRHADERPQASTEVPSDQFESWSGSSDDESILYGPHPSTHSRRRLRQRLRRQRERQTQRLQSHQQKFWKRVFHRVSHSPPSDGGSSAPEASQDEGAPRVPRIAEEHEARPGARPGRAAGVHRAWEEAHSRRNSDSHRTQNSGVSTMSGDDEPTISDLLMATVGVDLSLSAFRRVSHLYQISPTDVACQLTIIESSCYCQIQPFELINKEFSRGDSSRAHNVRQMTRWCTQITHWAAATILLEPTPVRRCRMLKYFIELGIQLLALKNYDAVMAINAAIYSASVMRLKHAWSLLPEKHSLMCRRIHEAMSPTHNYANYRSLLRRTDPPFLPFLGLYLTDLTFIEDGNPTYRRFEGPAAATPSQAGMQGDFHRLPPLQRNQHSSEGVSSASQPPSQAVGPVQLVGQTCALFARRQDVDLASRQILVNFEKAYRLAGVIREMQKFQVEYSGNFAMAIPGLQQYLIEQWALYESEGYNDDKIYNMSLNWEPRALQLGPDTQQLLQEQEPSALRFSRLLPGSQRQKNRDPAAQNDTSTSG